MRALVADDDLVTVALLSNALARWGIDTTVEHDGHGAWNAIAAGDGPSLAIVDWEMPGIDGPELCRRIRRSASLTHMYLILLTARDERADVVAGLDAGADDYIVKPFDYDELRARVNVGIRVLTLQNRLADRVGELQAARDELARVANTDALTDLTSRRRWFEVAAHELDRYRRYGRPFALLMADLDFFKQVNDTFGHAAGDEALKGFAEVLRSQCRRSDVIGRIGGEEFAVLLPETDAPTAEQIGWRIVERCRNVTISIAAHGAVSLTCSVGVAAASTSDITVEELLRRCDIALYAAKRHGKDRLESCASDEDGVAAVVRRTTHVGRAS
jgi:two-component system, cell cycle response regulator